MKNKYLLQSLFIVTILFFSFSLKAQRIVQLLQGMPTSIRGLSVVDDSIAWLSGGKGYIAITHNGGKSWIWQQVKGFENADFRDIEAFSDKEAIIMSSGTPALVLKTMDGGAHWQVKYNNADSDYFFDAMDFADKKHGYILGDPIANRFLLMETKDGGESWSIFKSPPDALPGEAAFAASGTCIRVDKEGSINIVTGGSHSRELIFDKAMPTLWNSRNLIIKHGKQSQGAFSLANGDCQVVVGGDYQNDKLTDSVAEYQCFESTYARRPIRTSKTPPDGYQSCVEFISGNTFLSTGTPGSNITIDGGKTWRKIDGTSFNVCRKAKRGKLVLLAGNDGKIGILKM